MSKHTPGPWTVHHRMRDCVTFEGRHGTENLFLSNIDGYYACQSEADARLIAATPDLLEFAQFVLRGLEAGHIKSKAVLDFTNADAENVPMVSLHSLARAVISKATGEDA